MPNYKTLEEAFKYLQNRIRDTLKDDVAKYVKEIESSTIQNVVYNEYEPYIYQRREDNGGLSDVNNMKSRVAKTPNGFVLTVKNTTSLSGMVNAKNLAELVEYGDDNGYGEYSYKYNRSKDAIRYLKSRPFTEETTQYLIQSNSAERILKIGLQKRNIKIV